ncbi:MAG: hypothetical protein EOP85_02010, partial [Verrucomicrobiaceae bacterium]
MKTIPFILWTTGAFSLLLLPLSGQNYDDAANFSLSFTPVEDTPVFRKSEPVLGQASPSYLYQRPGTLDAGKQITADESGMPHSGVLLVSHRKVASGSEGVISANLALLSASYREAEKPEQGG